VEAGWLVVDDFVDGVWLVELAPIADPNAVIAALAATMSIQPQPGMTMVESIIDWCLGRRMLLIIDNCEHVLEPAIEVVTAIIAECPTVTIIATSREPLGVEGERVNRIPSLPESFAVDLFCDRALAADANFTVTGGDSITIAAICARVDEIPLAIELAAARVRSLSPAELLDRLGDRFRLLRGGGRGGLERHQALRAAVQRSYQLLDEHEQLLFDRLSVFAGGFDLKAVEAICADDAIDEYDVIDIVGELVDKSMVIAERTGTTTRYRLLETLRQYGEEHLDGRDETSTLRDRHLAHYHDIAAGVEDVFMSPRQLEADELTAAEWDNFRAAHEWAITTANFDVATGILSGLSANSHLRHEASQWVDSTIELWATTGREDGFLFGQAASWAFVNGDAKRVLDLAERGIAAAAGDDEQAAATTHSMRIYGLAGCGRLNEASAAVPGLLELIAQTRSPAGRFWLWHGVIDAKMGTEGDEIGAPQALAEGQRYLGMLLTWAKQPPDVDEAIRACRNAVALADTASSAVTGLWARLNLAGAMVLGNRDEAPETLRDSITRTHDARAVLTLLNSIDTEVTYLVDNHRLEPAATLLGHLEGQPAAVRVAADAREDNLTAVADLPDLDALKARGAAMSRQEIVDFALAQLDD